MHKFFPSVKKITISEKLLVNETISLRKYYFLDVFFKLLKKKKINYYLRFKIKLFTTEINFYYQVFYF